MVGVTHRHRSDALKKEVDGPVRLLLGNAGGGYLLIPSAQPSRYDGFFIFDKEERQMYKILELQPGFSNLIAGTDSAETDSATYLLPKGTNSLVILPKSDFKLMLDAKKSYDNRQWGRIYKTKDSKGKLIIKYTKKTDSLEDPSHDQEEYALFVVVRHNGSHLLEEGWKKQDYPADRERGSPPFERHLYVPATISASRIVVSASKSLFEAEQESESLFKKAEEVESGLLKPTKDVQANFAYTSAIASLDNLMIDRQIMAGLPWFFQFWTRDQSVSAGALITEKRYELAKKILFQELEHILPDGRISNQLPEGGIGSIDSNGWCFFRLLQLLEDDHLTKLEKTFLTAKLEFLLPKFRSNHLKEDFVFGQAKETWMDTDANGQDTRAGARIEIQTLQLSLYKLLHKLTGKEEFLTLESTLRQKTRDMFWDGKVLKDGIDDPTIRPNIFLAYYTYPELLTGEEWKVCFDEALPHLWLEWGGLSTIDKTSPLYQPRHTGENNLSYHRGDSWYWLNNLAAICLHRLDKRHYSYQIDAILAASTREILWAGAIGSHAELSSAEKQESFGCLSQAWSLATYIEMVNEIFSR